MTENEKLARELSECVDILPKTLKEVQSAVYNACLDALDEQTTRHAMLMTGLEAQIEQKAVLRASELVDKAIRIERTKILELLDKAELEKWFDMPDTTENWKTWKKIRNTINREDV